MTVNYPDLAGEAWTDDTEAVTVHAAEHGAIASALHALRDALGGAAFDTYLGASTLAAKLNTVAASLAAAVQRANHTGTQAISTVSGLQTALDGKETAGAAAAVQTALLNGAPAGGDTLAELDARLAVVEALGSLATDAELIAAVAALIGTADTAGDTLGELQALINLRLAAANNLSDVANAATALANLGGTTLAAARAALVSNTAYDAGTWDGVTDVAPSKDAIRELEEARETLAVDPRSVLAFDGAPPAGTQELTTPGVGAATVLVTAGELASMDAATKYMLHTAVFQTAANELAVGDLLHVHAGGSLLNNTGSSRTLTLRVDADTVTQVSVAFVVSVASATYYRWNLDAWIVIAPGGVTTLCWGSAAFGNLLGSADVQLSLPTVGGAVDLTQPIDWRVSVQPSLNHADLRMTMAGGMMELYKA